jgi:AcrR family transcriptional regulator
MMKQLGKKDWLSAGFDILEKDGFTKVTIENLCGALGVTKGSFYHHFEHIGAYTVALMDFWLEENTLKVIQNVERSQADRNAAMLRMVAILRHRLELHIRAWSFSNPYVREVVAKADKLRLDYLTSLMLQAGNDHQTSREQAMLNIALMIGVQNIDPDMPADEWDRLQHTYSITKMTCG